MRVVIVDSPFDPLDALKRFEEVSAASGAIATFIGRCRSHAHGVGVTSLELQHYPGFTEREIDRFLEQVVSTSALRDALVVHRVGSIGVGEAIVLVAAASDHRVAALHAVESLMDFLKTDAPIWKREVTSVGERWIEPTALDYERRQGKTQQ
jgi:molybdopterin synthase catalytic subunit